eukprot:1499186-Ditylum_brightwellii.AAC.1
MDDIPNIVKNDHWPSPDNDQLIENGQWPSHESDLATSSQVFTPAKGTRSTKGQEEKDNSNQANQNNHKPLVTIITQATPKKWKE